MAFLVLVMTCLSGFLPHSWASEIHPSIAEIEAEFAAAPDENVRFRVLQQVLTLAPAIVETGLVRPYLEALDDWAQRSRAFGDADWVFGAAVRAQGRIVDLEVQQKTNNLNAIWTSNLDLALLARASEGFLQRFFSAGETQSFVLASLGEVRRAFEQANRVADIIAASTVVPGYIQDKARLLPQVVAHRAFHFLDELDLSEGELWLSRISDNSRVRVLEAFSDRLVLLESLTAREEISRILHFARQIYQNLWERFRDNPFETWRIEQALRVVGTGLLKLQGFGLELPREEVSFYLTASAPRLAVEFIDRLSNAVLDQSGSEGRVDHLLPVFQIIEQIITDRGLVTSQFARARAELTTLSAPTASMEGIYRIRGSERYQDLIVAHIDERALSAGVTNQWLSLKFLSFEYDAVSQIFRSQSLLSQRVHELELSLRDRRSLRLRISGQTCVADRIRSLPNYIEEARENEWTGVIEGVYRGHIHLESGEIWTLELEVSYFLGEHRGTVSLKDSINIALDQGSHLHNAGYVYLTSTQGAISRLTYLRARLDRNNRLVGVMFSTRRGWIGQFSASRVRAP